MKNLKEDTHHPGLPHFQRRKNILDSILQHLFLISHEFCCGNWSDLHPGHGPPRPWRATQMRNFILFPLLALWLVQGQEDRTGEKISDLLPASPSIFFGFQVQVFMLLPVKSWSFFSLANSQESFPQSWPSKPVDLQDSFELDLEFTLRSCSSTEWREFWKSMRWGCGSRRGELLSDANVAGTKEWLSYKLETRWLVVGFQREFFCSCFKSISFIPEKKIEHEPILVVCHKVIWQYEHQQIFLYGGVHGILKFRTIKMRVEGNGSPWKAGRQ